VWIVAGGNGVADAEGIGLALVVAAEASAGELGGELADLMWVFAKR